MSIGPLKGGVRNYVIGFGNSQVLANYFCKGVIIRGTFPVKY